MVPPIKLAVRALVVCLVAVALWIMGSTGFSPRGDDVFLYYEKTTVMLGEAKPPNPRVIRTLPNGEQPPLEKLPPEQRQTLYRDVLEEYPPLAQLFFLVPRLGSTLYREYVQLFTLEMMVLHLLVGVLMWWLMRRLSKEPLSPWRAAAAWAVFSIGASYFIARRFDTTTSLFAAGALVSALSRRPLQTGLLIGLGAATKLWPGLLLPILLLPALAARDLRALARMAGGAALGFLVPHLPFVATAGGKAFSYLGFHGARGLQLESTWGNLALLVSRVLPLEAHVGHSFRSYGVESQTGWTNGFLWISYVTLAAGYGAILALSYRSLRRTEDALSRDVLLTTAAAAFCLLLLATSKVFSPQFVVWIFPLVFVLPGALGRRMMLGGLVIAALTGVIFPHAYFQYVLTDSLPGTLLVFSRTVVIWTLLGIALRSLSRDEGSAVRSDG